MSREKKSGSIKNKQRTEGKGVSSHHNTKKKKKKKKVPFSPRCFFVFLHVFPRCLAGLLMLLLHIRQGNGMEHESKRKNKERDEETEKGGRERERGKTVWSNKNITQNEHKSEAGRSGVEWIDGEGKGERGRAGVEDV